MVSTVLRLLDDLSLFTNKNSLINSKVTNFPVSDFGLSGTLFVVSLL